MTLQKSLIAASALMLLFGCDKPAQTRLVSTGRPDGFERKRMCMEIANGIYQQQAREARPGQVVMNPEYCYSESLNTCLYAGGILGKNATLLWVLDCLTNREIVSHQLVFGVLLGVSRAEFDSTKQVLMAGCAK